MVTEQTTLASIDAKGLKSHMSKLRKLKQDHVYLVADETSAYIMCTDLDIEMKVFLEDHAPCQEFVKRIELKQLANALNCQGRVVFGKDGYRVNDFLYSYEQVPEGESVDLPCIQHDEEHSSFRAVDTEKLKDAIVFASKDEHRYILNTVYFDDNKLVATDGRRLIIIPHPSIGCKWLASVKACSILALYKNMQGSFGLRFGLFRHENVEVLVRRTDGNFPNYQNVMPDELTYESAWDPMFCSQDTSGLVKLIKGLSETVKLKGCGSKLKIEAECNAEMDGFVGNDIESNFDPKLLASVLAVTPSIMFGRDALAPLLGENNNGTKTVLMPMRN